MHTLSPVLLIIIITSLISFCCCRTTTNHHHHHDAQLPSHTNNWAVIVSTSKFWFNYRHGANALSMYRTVKRLGIPDSQIILMLADDFSCNPRNPFPAQIFNTPTTTESTSTSNSLNLYGENIEVDYRGYEVTVENFIRVLTGRHNPSVPLSKRLNTDDGSNILVYLTGHGGDEFLKFQDAEEINSWDVANAFQQMYEKRRYNEIMFVIDTCQASSMHKRFYSPNILSVGSSQVGENSYSHNPNADIGLAVIDRFTYYLLEFLEQLNMTSSASLKDLFKSFDPKKIMSTPGVRTDLFHRRLDSVRVTEFFGSILSTKITPKGYTLNHTAMTHSLPQAQVTMQVEENVATPFVYHQEQEQQEQEQQEQQFSLNTFISLVLFCIGIFFLQYSDY